MAKFAHSGGSKLINDFVERLVKGGRVTRTEMPFHRVNGKQQLKPDIVYVSGKRTSNIRYAYQTDSLGRIKSAHARPLELPPRNKRGYHNPNTPGKLPGDHAGHLFADLFGGSGRLDNLVSMSSNVNLSKMATLENNWARRIAKGERFDVDVQVIYSKDGVRPTRIDVFEIVDGVRTRVGFFRNS